MYHSPLKDAFIILCASWNFFGNTGARRIFFEKYGQKFCKASAFFGENMSIF
ncbi:hypothetical protein BACCOP_03920 [Phocaeicola coprocola DSM 17136]|uniref:Uncharacterized protein n=1 Tax=Phocaeicola coprocola DSM 17136 TaxID=470145 RepID=B3JPF9_9BACT|nr:hypothetical protein BACCOP_03920 [Phocaeicola coprocola DSM 17136]